MVGIVTTVARDLVHGAVFILAAIFPDEFDDVDSEFTGGYRPCSPLRLAGPALYGL